MRHRRDDGGVIGAECGLSALGRDCRKRSYSSGFGVQTSPGMGCRSVSNPLPQGANWKQDSKKTCNRRQRGDAYRNQAGQMRENVPPVRDDQRGRIKGLAAELTHHERRAVPHHICVDPRYQAPRRQFVADISRRCVSGSLDRGQISMAALIEGTRFISNAAGHHPPETGGILQIGEVQQPAKVLSVRFWLAAKPRISLPIVGDHGHLAVS